MYVVKHCINSTAPYAFSITYNNLEIHVYVFCSAVIFGVDDNCVGGPMALHRKFQKSIEIVFTVMAGGCGQKASSFDGCIFFHEVTIRIYS